MIKLLILKYKKLYINKNNNTDAIKKQIHQLLFLFYLGIIKY